MMNKGKLLSRSATAVVRLSLALFIMHLTTVDAATTLRLVQVVHRHGSRSSIAWYNKTEICGDVPCGQLNEGGQKMLVNAGEFLRKRYNEDSSVASEPFLPSESYNPDISYSRSTDSRRTMENSGGFLRGLFPDMSAFFPVVYTAPSDNDTLLRSDIFPQVSLFYGAAKSNINTMCNPAVDALLDSATLLAVAKEVFSEGVCSDLTRRCSCATILYDIGAAMESDGRIENFPLLKKNLKFLRSVSENYCVFAFGYNHSDDLHAKMGSKGQPLASQILANAELHMRGESAYKLYHYSAHDTTLSPLAATLRDESSFGVLPPFAQLYAFELLYDDVSEAYSMRVLRGHPGQTPDSGYAFSWEENFQLRCMNSSKRVYNAQENTCPYEDFNRLVDSSKPQDPAGLCYLDDQFKKLLKCPTKDGRRLKKSCAKYRKTCPAWSCPSGHTLDSVSLQCKCTELSCMTGTSVDTANISENRLMNYAAVVLAATGTFVLGCVCGFLILFLCFKYSHIPDKARTTTENEVF